MKDHEKNYSITQSTRLIYYTFVLTKLMSKLKLESVLAPSLFMRCDLCRLNSETGQFFTNGFLGVLNGEPNCCCKTHRGLTKLCIAGDNLLWTKRPKIDIFANLLCFRYRINGTFLKLVLPENMFSRNWYETWKPIV